MRLYGLIGEPLTHSFSEKYFSEKFEKESIEDCEYRLFPISSIHELPELINNNPNLVGLNITTPYKTQILDYVDSRDEITKSVGASNTVSIIRSSNKISLKAFNTDIFGFRNSIKPLLEKNQKKALILGSGGASKAVEFVLKSFKIEYLVVSRKPSKNQISFQNLKKDIIEDYKVIINATPLGVFPNIKTKPEIPYNIISKNHLLFDLTYNPIESEFLKIGKKQGAKTKNGLEMLHLQAEQSWKIWNEKE